MHFGIGKDLLDGVEIWTIFGKTSKTYMFIRDTYIPRNRGHGYISRPAVRLTPTMPQIEPIFYRKRKGGYNHVPARILQIVLVGFLLFTAVWTRNRQVIYNETNEEIATNEEIVQPSNYTRMHTNITLVIPALAFDFVHFADPLYESFERLTVLPEEVLMVVSNTSSLELNTTKYIKEKERFLQLQVDTGMRIRLLEYNYPVLQSVAKNIGAASATRQWVSVFDVDDVLHSQRFEVLDQVFKVRPEVNAVLTQFSFTTSAELKNNSVPVELYYTMDEIYNRTYDPQWIREEFAVHLEENNMALKGETPYSWCCPFIPNSLTANGWVSVKKDVWMKHQQRNNLPLGEDIEFNTRLIAGGENLTVVYANLGFYRWKSDAERPE